MATVEKPRFAVLLTQIIDNPSWSNSGPTLRITAKVVKLDPGIRNLSDYDSLEVPFADLEMDAHLDATSVRNEDGRAHLWSDSPRFRSVFAVDLRRSEVMTKTLKRIAAGEAKLTSRFGYAKTFGERMVRVFDSLGIDTYLIWQNPPGAHGTYDSGVFDTRNASGAMYWVEKQERDFVEAQKPVVTEEVAETGGQS